MTERVSERLLDQRIRNRIIEAVETLADGEAGVREAGFKNYFENFYDWIPHRDDGEFPALSTLTKAEETMLIEVSHALDEACADTPRDMTDDQLISTGWPARIEPIAKRVCDLMAERGRFSEEIEELEPSKPS